MLCTCKCSASQCQFRWEEETDRGISRSFPAQVSVQKEVYMYIVHEVINYCDMLHVALVGFISRLLAFISRMCVTHARSPSSPFRGWSSAAVSFLTCYEIHTIH